MSTKSRRNFLRSSLALAALAPRWARARTADGARTPALLDFRSQPRFAEPLPRLFDPDNVFRPASPGGSRYEIFAGPVSARTGVVDPRTGRPLATPMWGYGSASQAASAPGRSFVVESGKPISVKWSNRLAQGTEPSAHLLPVDRTVNWADPLKEGPVRGGEYRGPVPLVSHGHGGELGPESDGGPEQWSTPGDAIRGPAFNPDAFLYDNRQEAALLWYHDHVLGLTRLNVYAGLAGLYVIRDANEAKLVAAGELPSGPYEIALVIQDRQFAADGRLHYPDRNLEVGFAPSHVPEFFGDFILVNGRLWPVLEVEPRPYRLRLLNGSDSRFYDLSLPSGATVWQIGTDLGLLDAPVAVSRVLLSPGERADLVVDFARLRGRRLVLRNSARAPYPGGAAPHPQGAAQVMAFRVTRPLSGVPRAVLPRTLRPLSGPLPPLRPETAVRTRRLMLFEGTDAYGRLMAMLGVVDPGSPHDGTLSFRDPVTETPGVGDTEIWEIYNASADAHPIHLHLVAFRILDRQRFTATQRPKPMPDGATGGRLENIRLIGRRQAPAASEAGLKDTALMLPGEVTRIVATFRRPGRYVWHCHILSHEDHEMMRPFRVGG
jgi:spore coat protein A